MFVLWVFGVDVERLYGRERFMRLYLSLVVSSGLAWVAFNRFPGSPTFRSSALPARSWASRPFISSTFHIACSCSISCVPVPAWVLGIFYVGWDFYGVVSPTDNTAHAAHVAGALFGLLYVRTGWCLASLAADALAEMGQIRRTAAASPHGRRPAANAARSANAGRRDFGKNQPRRRSEPDARRTPRTRRPQPPVPQSAVTVTRWPIVCHWQAQTASADRRADRSRAVGPLAAILWPVAHVVATAYRSACVRRLLTFASGDCPRYANKSAISSSVNEFSSPSGIADFFDARTSSMSSLATVTRWAFDCNTTSEPSGCGAANPQTVRPSFNTTSCWRIDPQSPATGIESIPRFPSSGIVG